MDFGMNGDNDRSETCVSFAGGISVSIMIENQLLQQDLYVFNKAYLYKDYS